MSLSSLIVQREVASMRQVEDAMAHQVIYGGDLITNLLEVAVIDEVMLNRLLGQSMNLAPAPPGELPPPTEAVRALLPVETVTECLVAPLEVRDGRLVVAVAEPLPREHEARLALVLGMALEQRATSAFRVRQAIASAYGIPLDRRLDKLVTRLSRPPSKAASLPYLGSSLPAPRDSGTAAFETLSPTSLARPSVPAAVTRRPTISGFPGASTPPERYVAEPSTVPPPEGEGRVGLLQRKVSPSLRAAHRRRGPVTAEAAERAAEEASDRHELLDLYFDFSRQFFEYSALFLVHGDIAEGKDAFGVGAAPAKVLGIGVPLDMPSVLSAARDHRAPVIATIPEEGLDAVLLADLQRARGVEVAVVPLIVRTRTVALLIGDCGESPVDRDAVNQVWRFGATIGKAFERLIVRRKLDGFVAGSRTSGTGRIVSSMVPGKRVPGSSAPAPAAPAPAVPAPAATPAPAPGPAANSASAVPSRASWRPGPLSEPPPAANVAVLRPLSVAPIPREEPESPRVPNPPSVAPDEIAGDPVVELFDELGWEPKPKGDSRRGVTPDPEPPVLPESAAVAIPLHRPAHSQGHPPFQLPSVIVDLEVEFGALVDRAIAEHSEEAEGELLRQGERAMRVVMSRFPGPLTMERARIATAERPLRPSDCGPLLRLVVRERKVALPFVLERLEDDDPEVRGWATHVLCELPYVEAIDHLLVRLRDVDPITRVSAAHALAAVARPFPLEVREAALELAKSADPFDRASAMRVMAETRQPALVPEMVHALGDGDEDVVAAGHAALALVTRQDFGADARPWIRWWEQNAGRHRVEWLIDALVHDVSEIRRGAAEELRMVSKEYFGYAADLPPRDRERAQQRYRDWWITEGRARFRRI